MKIAVVNTYDVQGGAARAAARLHSALDAAGADATMLVAHKQGQDDHVHVLEPRSVCRALRVADDLGRRLALLPYRKTRPDGYEAFQPDRPLLGRLLERQLPSVDLINLHWVAELLDFTSLPRLAMRAPIVWTLHDMLPMTGGCHYDGGCDRYRQQCGACPQLGSTSTTDLSATIFARRRSAFAQIPAARLHFVAPSRWLADQVRGSPLCGRFQVSVIPYSLDLEVFAPSDRASARASLGLAQDRVAVLFVADDLSNRRKGMRLLLEALEGLRDLSARLLLISVGRAALEVPAGLEYRHFPFVGDDRQLARIYSAADVLAIPSLQDNLPNTMVEAMACGTAVVGFATGGIPDLVRPGETGWLVPSGSIDGLRATLRRIAADPGAAHDMGRRARDLVLSECSPAVQARRYCALFERMLGGTRGLPGSSDLAGHSSGGQL
jgi:glycosyltransferase involved in cell wall biosynthesis